MPPAHELHELVPPPPAEWEYVGSDERGIILRTDFEAERIRLVLVDRKTGQLSTLVAERKALLQLAATASGRLIIGWLVDARSEVTVHDRDGQQLGTIDYSAIPRVSSTSVTKVR